MNEAEAYQQSLVDTPIEVPPGAQALVQVVVFNDESIQVAGPPLQGYGEEYIVAALQSGLELYGYKVTLERDDTLVRDVVVHDPIENLVASSTGSATA